MIVITFLSVSIVASKAISAPAELVAFNVIKASTFVSESAVSSTSLIASVNVSVIFEPLATAVAPFTGLNVIVGAVLSLKVAVLFDCVSDAAFTEAS